MSRSEFNVSPALRHLITSDHPMTWRRIWRTLPLSMRTEAIFVLLRDPDEAPDLREYLVGSIAEHKHFRRRTVESFDDNKLANDGARLKIVSERVIRSLLVALHIHARVPLMMTILGALGIKSEQGLVESSDIPHDAIPHDALHAATSDALREHSAENIAVYLLSMQALYGTPFSGVRKVLARFLPTDEQVAPRIEQQQ